MLSLTHLAIAERRRELLGSRRKVGAPIGGKDKEAIDLGALTRLAAIPPQRGLFLSQLARLAPSGDILELGSNVGIGTALLADVIRERRENGGSELHHVYSVEGVPGIAEAARRTLKIVGLDDYATVMVTDFESALRCNFKSPFGMAFIDGSHTYEPTISCVQAVTRMMMPNGMIVIDDVGQTEGIARAWVELSRALDFSVAWTDGRFGVLSVARSL